jgi:hypothetical protein
MLRFWVRIPDKNNRCPCFKYQYLRWNCLCILRMQNTDSTRRVVSLRNVLALNVLKRNSARHLLIISLLSFKGQDFVDPYQFRV